MTGPGLAAIVAALIGALASAGAAQTPADPSVEPSADTPEQRVRQALDAAAESLSRGDPRQAMFDLQPIDDLEPDNPWLLFYRGVADLTLGNPHQAMAAFDRSLELLAEFGDPDPELARQIALYRRQARRQVFSLSYEAGLAYDTNVSYLGDVAIGVGLIAGQGDWKFGSALQMHYAPIATEEHALSVGARVGNSWYFELDDFDYQDYGGYVRYARRLDDQWLADLQYDYDVTFLGNDPFASIHMVTPGIEYHWTEEAGPLGLDRTRLYYVFAAGNFLFETPPAFDRDGFSNTAGIEQSFWVRPLPEIDYALQFALGYRFSNFNTEGTEFNRYSHEWYLDMSMPLVNPGKPDEYLILPDKELVFRFNADWLYDDYRFDSLIDATSDRREDLTMRFSWGLSQTLVQDVNYGELVLHGLISWTDARSNITTEQNIHPFTYNKAVFGVQLEWTW